MNRDLSVVVREFQGVAQEIEENLKIAPLITVDLTPSPVVFLDHLRGLNDRHGPHPIWETHLREFLALILVIFFILGYKVDPLLLSHILYLGEGLINDLFYIKVLKMQREFILFNFGEIKQIIDQIDIDLD